MGYFQIIRADGSSRRTEEVYERVLWGDLTVMFKPDVESEVWRNIQGYNVTVWKLFSLSGVHFVRFQNLHIFMLVEKKYPLTPATITKLLNKKIQTDHWNEMCYQLLKLMTKQVKKPGISAAGIKVNAAGYNCRKIATARRVSTVRRIKMKIVYQDYLRDKYTAYGVVKLRAEVLTTPASSFWCRCRGDIRLSCVYSFLCEFVRIFIDFPFFDYGELNPPPNNRPVPTAALRARVVQELHELQIISAFVDSHLECIEQFLNNFANQPDETDMNNLEFDDESVDTPLVSPFPHSNNDSNDGEVLNELMEYENVGMVRRERAINSFDGDDLAFQCSCYLHVRTDRN
ncbi:hypothetical protein Tco_0409159 [Tanacetum coccineum]